MAKKMRRRRRRRRRIAWAAAVLLPAAAMWDPSSALGARACRGCQSKVQLQPLC